MHVFSSLRSARTKLVSKTFRHPERLQRLNYSTSSIFRPIRKSLPNVILQAEKRLFNRSSFLNLSNSTPVPKMCPEKVEMNECGAFERLPKIARPVHYNIHVKPYLNKFTFEGEESVDFEILTATNILKLNSSQLTIKEASLIMKDSEAVLPLTFENDEAREIVTFKLPREIAPGKAQLKIKFEGMLNDRMKGFYRSKFKNDKGEDDYMGTTQFESTFARQAFPCWDEPCYKATFDLSLTVPKNKTALSNMNEISQKDHDNGWKTLQFATTPVMSSYLVAYIVGDFEFVEGYTTDNVRVRIYTLSGKKYQGEYALQVALKAIPFFSKFFGIPYGLPKCDLIAIPDFNFGAMENWGLVTYREVFLLLDPAKSSTLGKEHITLVVAHELAHMWFGNLTTMEWWTDLWLKEGYATWMEYYFTHEVYPEFDIFSQFLTAETLRAMSLDGLKNSHPVEVPINDPNEIEDIYDAVSYSKSASLIRMLHEYLGDDVFRTALQNYLKKYSFKNTKTQNLWDELSQASGKNVAALMGTWTKHMGFPLIKVSATAENGKVTLHMEQERFLSDGSTDKDNITWEVPICIATSSKGNPKAKFLLTKKLNSFVLDNVGAEDWIKLNAGFSGFYKVQYSNEMLEKLNKPLAEKTLAAHDRLNICGDLFSLVRCGKMPSIEFLRLMNECKSETDFMVWSEIDSGLDTLQNVLQCTDFMPDFDAFCRKLYATIAKSLGWQPKPNEAHSVGMLRPLILRRLGVAGDEETIKMARQLFKDFVHDGKDMTPDLRSMVFGIVGKYDGETAQQQLMKIFETSDFSEIQRQCLVAIGRTTDPALQQKALEYAFESGKVRLQDSYLLSAGLSTSKSGQEMMWTYFKRNMRELISKFGSPSSSLFSHLLKTTIQHHCTESMASEVEDFFKEHKDVLNAANRPIQQSLENIRLNVALLKRDRQAIKEFLAKKP